MSDLLDDYTSGEKAFIWTVETNRGEIKNKEKFYPILADIYSNATDDFKEELTVSKHIGVQMVHKIVTTLTLDEQKLMTECLAAMPKITAQRVRLDFANILANR